MIPEAFPSATTVVATTGTFESTVASGVTVIAEAISMHTCQSPAWFNLQPQPDFWATNLHSCHVKASSRREVNTTATPAIWGSEWSLQVSSGARVRAFAVCFLRQRLVLVMQIYCDNICACADTCRLQRSRSHTVDAFCTTDEANDHKDARAYHPIHHLLRSVGTSAHSYKVVQ